MTLEWELRVVAVRNNSVSGFSTMDSTSHNTGFFTEDSSDPRVPTRVEI